MPSPYLNGTPRSPQQAQRDSVLSKPLYIHVYEDEKGGLLAEDSRSDFHDAVDSLCQAIEDGGWAHKHKLTYAYSIVMHMGVPTVQDLTEAVGRFQAQQLADDADRMSSIRAHRAGTL